MVSLVVPLKLQGWAKEWTLGCVNSPLATREIEHRRRDSRNLGSTL